jgi:hypothetical protein
MMILYLQYETKIIEHYEVRTAGIKNKWLEKTSLSPDKVT